MNFGVDLIFCRNAQLIALLLNRASLKMRTLLNLSKSAQSSSNPLTMLNAEACMPVSFQKKKALTLPHCGSRGLLNNVLVIHNRSA